jgi:hypothetical protein
VPRARAWLLLALTIGVVLTWSTSAATGRLFDTYGYFSRTASNTGNTITAGSLATPSLSVSAGPSVEPGTITLSWTLPLGDLATQIEIYRAVGGCSGFSLLTTVAKTPATYADSGLSAGTYCYQVRGKVQSWVSGFSGAQSATIQPAVTMRELKLGSSNDLTTGTTTGTVSINASAQAPFDFYVWSTSGSVTVTGNVAWALNLTLDTSNPFQSTTLAAEVRLNGGATCTGGTLVASGGPQTFTTGSASMTLIPNTIAVPQSGTLCLKITNISSDSGAAHRARIITDGTSKLTGPWDP